MQITIVEYSNDIITTKEKENTVYIADFDTGVGAIPITLIDNKGDIIVGTGSDSVNILPVGTNGYTLTADSAAPNGIAWKSITEVSSTIETTLNGNKSLYDIDVKYQYLDPGGASRIITLPENSANNHQFVITNTSDSQSETLTIRNTNDDVIGTIASGLSMVFISDGTNWRKLTKHRQLWVANWKPTITNGCISSAQMELATNKNVVDYTGFENAATKYGYANVPMPEDYTGGTVYYKAYWMHPTATAYVVRWQLSGVAVGNNETLDVATGTAVAVDDTGGTANNLYISDLSGAVTIAGTPAAGELVQFLVSRAGAHANDTLDVTARLIGVMLWYPVG